MFRNLRSYGFEAIGFRFFVYVPVLKALIYDQQCASRQALGLSHSFFLRTKCASKSSLRKPSVRTIRTVDCGIAMDEATHILRATSHR